MSDFPWQQHLNINLDTSWQVRTLTEILLNSMSNFIPNEFKRIVPRDPPWITKLLKCMISRKNRLFKNFKRHGYKPEDEVRLDNFRKDFKRHGYKPEDEVRLDNFRKDFHG